MGLLWLISMIWLLKYYVEAAELFEGCGNKEQAAGLYARLKNWNKVGKLIHVVTQPKVHIAYAKVSLHSFHSCTVQFRNQFLVHFIQTCNAVQMS